MIGIGVDLVDVDRMIAVGQFGREPLPERGPLSGLDARVVDVQGKDIWVRMGGGCQGCGSAAATMTQGVERLIRDAIPEVERIVDATDHQAGTNPYYAPSN